MNLETIVNSQDDLYIQSIIEKLTMKYGKTEALRGQWIVTFIYYVDGTRQEAKVKKATLEYTRERNKLPLTIIRLLK